MLRCATLPDSKLCRVWQTEQGVGTQKCHLLFGIRTVMFSEVELTFSPVYKTEMLVILAWLVYLTSPHTYGRLRLGALQFVSK